MHPEYDNYWPAHNSSSTYHSLENSGLGKTARPTTYKPLQNRSQPVMSSDPYLRNTTFSWSPSQPTSTHQNNMSTQYAIGAPHQLWKSAPNQGSNFSKAAYGNNIQQDILQSMNRDLQYSLYNGPTWPNRQDIGNFSNPNGNVAQINAPRTVQNKSAPQGIPQIRVKDVFSLNNSVSAPAVNSKTNRSQTREEINCSLDFLSGNTPTLSRGYENISPFYNVSDKRCEQYTITTQSQTLPGMVINGNQYKQPVVNNNHWPPDKQCHLRNIRGTDNNNSLLNACSEGVNQRNLNKNILQNNHQAAKAYNSQLRNKQLISDQRRFPQPVSHNNSDSVHNQTYLSPNLTGRSKEGNNISLFSLLQSNNNVYYSASKEQETSQISPVTMEATADHFNKSVSQIIPPQSSFANTSVSYAPSNTASVHYIPNYEYCINGTNSEAHHRQLIGNFAAPTLQHMSGSQNQNRLNEQIVTEDTTSMVSIENRRHELVTGYSSPKICQVENARSLAPDADKFHESSLTQNDNEYQNDGISNGTEEALTESLCDVKPVIITESSESSESSVQKEYSTSNEGTSASQPVVPKHSVDNDFRANSPPKGIAKKNPEKKCKNLPENTHLLKDALEGTPKTKKPCFDMPLLDNFESTPPEQTYENKINRDKLDLLIEFLEKDTEPVDCKKKQDQSLPKTTSGTKRKLDDIAHSPSRRKLSKQSIVKNKNNSKEMIVCRKTSKGENLKRSDEKSKLKSVFREIKVEVSESLNNKTSTKSLDEKEEKKSKDKIDANESKLGKNQCPRRDSTKENNENKGKSRKEVSSRPTEKGSNSNYTSQSNSSITSQNKNTVFEETGILSTMKAFQKIDYHYCMTCNLQSSNDSFWINVVSGELRCLNCFKKMSSRMDKPTFEGKSVQMDDSSTREKSYKHQKPDKTNVDAERKKDELKHTIKNNSKDLHSNETKSKQINQNEKESKINLQGNKELKCRCDREEVKKLEEIQRKKSLDKDLNRSPAAKTKKEQKRSSGADRNKETELAVLLKKHLQKESTKIEKKKEVRKNGNMEDNILKKTGLQLGKEKNTENLTEKLKKGSETKPDKYKDKSQKEQQKDFKNSSISPHHSGERKKHEDSHKNSNSRDRSKLSNGNFKKEKTVAENVKKQEDSFKKRNRDEKLEKSKKHSTASPALIAELQEKTKELSRSLLEQT